MRNWTGEFGLFGREVHPVNNEDNQLRLLLTHVTVKAEVLDFIAEVKVSQSYVNPKCAPVEAIYHFPVNEAASVCDFQAEQEDGTVVRGIAKEKREAREEYEEATRRGKQANLLEVVRRDVFMFSAGNIPSNGSVKITITYVTALKAQGEAAAFVLPTYIAPRYTPTSNNDLVFLEAEALSPPSSLLKHFGINVDVNFKCRSNIKTITSPTHAEEPSLVCQSIGKTGTASLNGIPLDRDLVLLVTEELPHQPRACVEVREDGSLVGLVTIFPRIEFEDTLNQEIVFVVDRSGSMMGSKIDQARDALLLFLRALPPSCSFNIVGFGSTYTSLFNKPMPYNDRTLDRASEYASRLEANLGGTEIKEPLEYVLGRNLAAGSERQVFILTDGQVSNDLEVFHVIRENCLTSGIGSGKGHCRVFSLGIGGGVSRHLVEGMARVGRGTARFVEGSNSNDLRVKVLEQLKHALQPALEEVSIDWVCPPNSEDPPEAGERDLLRYRSPKVDKRYVPRNYPSSIPPVFNNERFISFALFASGSKDIPESVTIKCNTPDGPLQTTIQISDDDVFRGSIAHKMAARAAISEYEDNRKGRHAWQGKTDDDGICTKEEALHLAVENNLASEMTSFIAVCESPSVDSGTVAKRTVIPQQVSQPKQQSQPTCSVNHDIMMRSIEEVLNRGCKLDNLCEVSESLSRQSKMFYKSTKKNQPWWQVMLGFVFSVIVGTVGLVVSTLLCSMVSLKERTWGDSTTPDQTAAGPTEKTKPEQSGRSPKQAIRNKTSAHSNQTDRTLNGSESTDLHRKAASSLGVAAFAQSEKAMKLCLLQKADGKFLFDKRLADAVGLSVDAKERVLAALSESQRRAVLRADDPMLILGTLVAIATMRSSYVENEDMWELHEEKARKALLRNGGVCEDEMDSIIRELQVEILTQK